MARKTKLNDVLIEKAKKYIAGGNFAIVVCQYLGVCEATYYSWINRAEQDIKDGKDTIFVKFLKAIKEAEAQAEIRNVTLIQTAAQDTWQAAAWFLERKHKRWAQKQDIEIKKTPTHNAETIDKRLMEIREINERKAKEPKQEDEDI